MAVELFSPNSNVPRFVPLSPVQNSVPTWVKCKDAFGYFLMVSGALVGGISDPYSLDPDSNAALSGYSWGAPVLGMSLVMTLNNKRFFTPLKALVGGCCGVNRERTVVRIQQIFNVCKAVFRLTGTGFAFIAAAAVNSDPNPHPSPIFITTILGAGAFLLDGVERGLIRVYREGNRTFGKEVAKEIRQLYDRSPEKKLLLDKELESLKARAIAGTFFCLGSVLTQAFLWRNPWRTWDPNIETNVLVPVSAALNAVALGGISLAVPVYSDPRVSVISKVALRTFGMMIAGCTFFSMQKLLQENSDPTNNEVLESASPFLLLALIVSFFPEWRYVIDHIGIEPDSELNQPLVQEDSEEKERIDSD
jgi:hypothetical protein